MTSRMNATQKTKELFLVHRKRKTRNQTVYNKQNKIGLCTELKNKAVFSLFLCFKAAFVARASFSWNEIGKMLGHNSNFFFFSAKSWFKKTKISLLRNIFWHSLFFCFSPEWVLQKVFLRSKFWSLVVIFLWKLFSNFNRLFRQKLVVVATKLLKQLNRNRNQAGN